MTNTYWLLSSYRKKFGRLGIKLPDFVALISTYSFGSNAVNGSLLQLKRVEPPEAYWIFPEVSSYAIRPENLLKVLGMRISGLMSIVTP